MKRPLLIALLVAFGCSAALAATQYGVLRRPVTTQVAYGELQLHSGMRFHIVRRDDAHVFVTYMGAIHALPSDAVAIEMAQSERLPQRR